MGGPRGGNDRGGPRGGGERPPRSPPRRQRQERQEREERPEEGKRGGRWDGEREKESQARSSRKRSRSPSRRSRSPARRSRSRSRSPPRRRARTAPRYNVSVPKVSLNFPQSNVMELKKRYSNLYIPSDFFTAKHSWNEAFPIEAPFHVQYTTAFHTFSKEAVEAPAGLGPARWQFDPPDADYSWVAKVMLLSSPSIEELYEKTCNLVDSGSREREDLVHPTRALKFLVGLKEKREVMAIGGPWSASLDGGNPESDPSTLIKTAIRTCGALTGIDLGDCTRWTRFLQIHYRRQVTSTKPARTETVVIFFPDVWSVMPTKLEYDGLVEQYGEACRARQEGKVPGEKEGDKAEVQEVVEEEEEEVTEEIPEGKVVAEPTHWATLDPKAMKVGELRDQLEARGQLNKGLKSQLQARLQKCLKTEQESEQNGGGGGEEDMVTEEAEQAKEGEEEVKEEASVEEVTVVLDDRQKEKMASAYKTPSHPCLFVHPNTKAKGGKFDCRTESLSVLLDYRSEDNKEGTFEVSLFAELFNEMMLRDSAFQLYTALQAAPERVKEDRKEKKEESIIPIEATKEAATAAAAAEVEPAKTNAEEEKTQGEEKAREASVEMVEEKEKVMVTKNKELLLGASYFDLSHCGYLETKDVEDLLVTLELDLSRAEVRKLAGKLAAKEQVNYRQLTDGEAAAEEPPPAADLQEIARGFKRFLPAAATAVVTEGRDDAMITFRGTVVDVGKLQDKLDRSERVRAATDTRLIDLQKKFGSLKDSHDKGEKTRDKLAADLRESRKKGRSLEEEAAQQAREAARYLACLGDVYSKVMPIVRPPKATEVKGTETVPQVNGVAEKEVEAKAVAAEGAAEEEK